MAGRSNNQTQSKYVREVVQSNDGKSPENEIRVRRDGPTGAYINRAAELFLKETGRFDTVIISAIGQAIPIALAVSEKIREKIAGIHAIQSIQTVEKTVKFRPQESGLDEITQTRYNAAFKIVLTLKPTNDDLKAPGYSAPRTGVVTATLEEIKSYKQNNRQGRQQYPPKNQSQNRSGYQGQGRRDYGQQGGNRDYGQQGGNRPYSQRNQRNGQTQRRGNPRQEKRYDGPQQQNRQN